MKHFNLKFLTFFLTALLAFGVGWAEEVTITKTVNELRTENNWTISYSGEEVCYTDFNLDDNINISTTGKPNCGSVWQISSTSTTLEWRLYRAKNGNVIVKALNGCTLKSIKFTYAVSNSGTLTGAPSESDVTVEGTEATFTVNNTNSSTNGQVKIREFSVTYETPVTDPTITVNPETLTMSAMVGQGQAPATAKFMVNGSNLKDDITLTLSDETGAFSINPATISKDDASGEVTVTYSPTVVGTHTATITVASTDAEPKTITLNGTATQPVPVITVTPPDVMPFNDEGGIFTVKAANMPDNGLGVFDNDGHDPAVFQFSAVDDTFTPNYFPLTNGAIENGKVRVNYIGRELSFNGTIGFASGSANATADVSYRSDVFVICNLGNAGWNYGDGSHPMTYANDKYTATVTVPDNSWVMFARKTGETYDWNENNSGNGGNRFFFGAKTDNDGDSWWYGAKTSDALDLDPTTIGHTKYSPIWFEHAGEYTITIDPVAKTFSIRSSNVYNLTQANKYPTGETFTFNGRVVVTHRQGKNLWIRDVQNRDGSTTAGYIYSASNGADFEPGDVIKAGWTGKKTVYNGLDEFQNVSGLVKDGTADYAPEELIAINPETDVNKYVVFRGVNKIVDIDGNVVSLRDQFNTGFTFEEGKTYDIVGIVSYYNSLQFYPIKDLSLNVSLESDTKTALVGKTIPVTVTVENAVDNYTVTYKFGENGTETTLDGNVINVTSETAGTVDLFVTVTNNGTTATASETYTFRNPDAPLATEFILVTDISQLEDGKQIVIADKNTNTTTTALGKEQTANNRKVANLEISNLKITASDATEIINLEKDGGYWYLRARKTPGYLYAPGGGNYLRTKDEPQTDAQATISIASDGEATVVFNITATQKNLRYNSNNDIYSCYASGQKPIYIYVEKPATPTLLDPELSFVDGEGHTVTVMEAKVGDDITEPTLTGVPQGATVSYSSSDETLATVDASGAVTLLKAGEVTITANTTATDEYNAGTATYKINILEQVATPTFTPVAGEYTGVQNVAINCTTEEVTIYYTTDGTVPNAQSSVYSTPIKVAANMTIKAIAVKEGMADSEVATAAYQITLEPVATPTFSPEAGTYDKAQTVEISAVEGATIYYTTNGTDPTTESSKYTEPITVSETTTIKAIAVKEDMLNSTIAEATYVILKDPELAFVDGEGNPVTVMDGEIGENITEPTLTGIPQGATVTYTIANDNGDEVIATIDAETGAVDLQKAGTVTVTATTTATDEYNAGTATYKINISKKNVTVTFGDTPAEVYVGSTFTATATTNPEGLTVTYNSSKPDVAEVNAETGEVTAKAVSAEPVNITASFAGNDEYKEASAQYTITVKAKEAAGLAFVDGEGNPITEPIIIDAKVGDDITEPNVFTNGLDVSYSSEPESVATVDDNGNVTIVGPGTAIITISTEGDATHSAGSITYTINISKKDVTVTFGDTPAEVYVGSKFTATATTQPEGLTVTYSSSAPDVADVNAETGEVTAKAVSAEPVTITATYAGNDEYNKATGEYSFTIKAKEPAIVVTATFDPEGKDYVTGEDVTVTATIENAIEPMTVTYSIENSMHQMIVNNQPFENGTKLYTDEPGNYYLTIKVQDNYPHEGNAAYGSTEQIPYLVRAAATTIEEAQATPQLFKYNGDAVVAYQNGNLLWIRDAEDNSGLIRMKEQGTFANGDNLNPGWTATYRSENDLPLFVDGANLSVKDQGETVEPYALTTFTADDVNKYASLSEILITEQKSDGYYYFTVGDQEYALNKMYCADAPEVGKYYNVVGVVTRNSSKVWMDLISIEEVNPVAIAGPTFCPAGGTYTEPKEVAIACATPGMKIMYKIGEGEWTEYKDPFTVSENCTVYAMGTMGNRTVYTDSEVTSATYTINTLPAATITDGYYNLVNNSPEVEGLKANVAGRRTMNFVSDAADKAGTVFRIAAENGVVKTLRSQGVDLKQYADRAMNYVDPIINTVIDKLTTMEGVDDPTGAGTILGQEGLGKLIQLFKDNLDNNLYVEGNAGAYRIYARTPSMQPVVDFYNNPENTDKIEAKLPDLEGYINQVLNKVRAKVNSAGMNGEDVIPKFNLVDVWQNMGGTLIKPEGENVLPFYRQVLTNKEYVWNFALQTAKIYLEAIKSTITDMNMVPAEYGDVIGKLESVRPETKYFIIQRSRAAGTGELDYISENNVEIINNDSRTFWSLPELTDFTVNFPEENKYGSKLVTTLYTDFAYDVPEGVTAYKVTAINNGIATIADLGKNVPAQTPVLLMTEAAAKATTKNVTLNTTDGTRPDGNLLEGPDYLINKYKITSPTVEALFAIAAGIVGGEESDAYQTYVKPYEYLKLRTSGTVNNRYFWGLSNDDTGKCSEENSDGLMDCVVRALGVDEDGKNIGFYRNRDGVLNNKAFIPTIEFNPILLEVVATPTFDPEAGTYNEAQTVTIACETEGATIYYKIGDEDWTEFDPEQPIRVEATTTIQAYAAKDGLGDSEIAEATYKIELPAEAPTFDPVPGSYEKAQDVTIIAPEGATVSYRIDGGEWQTYTPGEEIHVDATQTIEAKVVMEGMSESAVATGYYVIDIPEALPTDMPEFDGYYSILNSGKYANVQGRKTLTFTTEPDAQAGTVIRLKSDNTGKVEVLRSQAADLQRYAYRALDYVPDIVQIVVDKLGAEGEGHILGKDGLDAIMAKFDQSFKPDLYIEKAGDNGYRIYGKTPSMQPVVDFYRENKDNVEAKLPDLVEFINSALAKLRNKANQAGMDGDNVFVDFDLKTIWTRMGGNLTDPEVDEMGFYRDVLNYKDNVWNFAYQTATFYLEKIKNTGTYASLIDKLGEYAQYLDKIDQVHPDFKYYIVANEDVTKPDFISEGNTDIINNIARTIWTIEPREKFTVTFPEANKYQDGYVTTLYTDFAYTLPEGVTAYAITDISDQGIGELTAIESTTIAAQTPVLLKVEAPANDGAKADVTADLTITTADGTAAPEGNLLVGADFFINTYGINTPQLVTIFQAIQQKWPSLYEQYMAQYEHLMLKTSGTVNNKYFWGLTSDDAHECTEENSDGLTDCVIRILGVNEEGKSLGFYRNWDGTPANQAFLANVEFNPILLTLRGDINRNGEIEIGDVTALIDILLDLPAEPYHEPSELYPKGLDYEAADFNEDGEIAIKDVTVLIDYLLDNM